MVRGSRLKELAPIADVDAKARFMDYISNAVGHNCPEGLGRGNALNTSTISQGMVRAFARHPRPQCIQEKGFDKAKAS